MRGLEREWGLTARIWTFLRSFTSTTATSTPVRARNASTVGWARTCHAQATGGYGTRLRGGPGTRACTTAARGPSLVATSVARARGTAVCGEVTHRAEADELVVRGQRPADVIDQAGLQHERPHA